DEPPRLRPAQLIVPERTPVALEERSVEDVMAQMEKVRQLMSGVLKEGEHYGVIPGTGGADPEKKPKPTLLQPGAQKLCFMFRLAPRYVITRNDLPNGHREFEIRCELVHAGTGQVIGEGVGSCSTMESKYRWRMAERSCPDCGKDTIKRSKYDDKGWYCFAKIGGCGAQFAAVDARIIGQEVGRKENPDIADVYNTVLKIAKKRAFVDATLTATAAGDSFTQDLEDIQPTESAATPEPAKAESPKTASSSKLITKAQAADLWKRALARAEQTGATNERIMRDVLVFLKLDATASIPAAELEHVVHLIEDWDPELQVGEETAKE
ncbi:MAG: hypothetical protein ACREUP_13130, partial [Burkholderiales bacterium]